MSVVRPLETATPAAARYHDCAAFLGELDAVVRTAGVRDVQAVPVSGFPYLRTNRFLASLADEGLGGSAFEQWVDWMRRLFDRARQLELANLPSARRRRLQADVPAWLSGVTPVQASATCAERMRQQDLAVGDNRNALRVAAASVPSAYEGWKRWLGLYYLSVWPVAGGVKRWQEQTRAVFATPLEALPVAGRLTTFAPPSVPPSLSPSEVRERLLRSSHNPLGIPDPDPGDRARLFATFAPRWEIDVAGPDDRMGAVAWAAGGGGVEVDTRRPTVYRHLSHTRLGGQVLLQLNYTIWFPARPRRTTFDLLAGHLDGVTWRVTLGRDGLPLLYDSIHNCGCYHLFLPTPAVEVITQSRPLQEGTFVVQELVREQPVTLRLAHTSHYLQRAHTRAWAGEVVTYRWADYEELRSLPVPAGGRRSLFGEDGIVRGTQRGERWILWPMGVPQAGAMRQWGHHATAFVGRRHFDDPFLYAGHFRIRSPADAR